MRFLATIFTLLILLFGFAALVMATENPGATGNNVTYYLGQVGPGGRAPGSQLTLTVDRGDDPEGVWDCTPAPGDCPLRSAIIVANQDLRPTKILFDDHYLIRLTRSLPALFEDGTTIYASPGQEVHIDGNNSLGSVLRVTGSSVSLEGLRLYGAGAGYPTLSVSGTAQGVLIANNVIGDDDAPSGNCGQSVAAYGGIYVDTTGSTSEDIRAWIVGNVIECHGGFPGEGITVLADHVVIGQDASGQAGESQRNIIRNNLGIGVNIVQGRANTVRNTLLLNNMGGPLSAANFDNNIFDNIIK